MKVIIAGSRDAKSEVVRTAIDRCPWAKLITVVVSGTASGADAEGERWAMERGIPIERFVPDWKTFGKRAGPLRNKEMAESAHGLVAVWDGSSPGTSNMIDLARERGLRIFVYRTNDAKSDDIPPQGELAASWATAQGGNSVAQQVPIPRSQEQTNHPTKVAKSRVETVQGTERKFQQPHRRTDTQHSPRFRLNTLLAFLSPDATLIVGRQPYQNSAHLDELRERLRESHMVKRTHEGLESVAYDSSGEIVGERADVRLVDRPDLTQRLLGEWLARSMSRFRVRWGRGGIICYVSDRPDSNILNEVLPAGIKVPEGIGRRIAADFDVRRIRGTSGQSRLVIAIDVRTRITIDCGLTNLLSVGVDPTGLYVQHEIATPHGPRRRLAGRVRAIEGDTLILDDHDPDVGTLPTSAAWLEPRKENLERIIHAVAGPLAVDILARLRTRVAERLGGKARPALVDEWVASIRRFPDVVAQGVRVRFDSAVMRTDGGRFPEYDLYNKPRLVFDVGRTKTETWNQGGLDKHGPYNFERFTPKRLNIAVVCQASRQGEVERFIEQLLNGIPGSKYAEKGFVRRYQLDHPLVRTFTCKSPSAKHYREAVGAAIDDATTRNEKWNLALIQTDEAFHELSGNENPYLVTKALFLTHQVSTQAFEWESIRPGMPVDAVVNNIGLAAYAKVNGIPWLLPLHQTMSHEFVVGLGSFEASDSRLGGRERFIGVTTVFSADGRYILESRTPAVPAAEYLPALLAALERVIGEVRRQQAWSEDQPVRLIFHVFKDFNQREIEAVKQLMAKLKLPHIDFAFIHLVEDHPFMLFDQSQEGIGQRLKKGVAAAPRGLRVNLSHNEVLLCLKGPKELRQWSDGIPKPMLLRLHRESTFKDLSYLARQVFDFSCLSWRTLLPSPLPISVLYSDLVARNLLLLRDVQGWSPETILGPVGRTRWFL